MGLNGIIDEWTMQSRAKIDTTWVSFLRWIYQFQCQIRTLLMHKSQEMSNIGNFAMSEIWYQDLFQHALDLNKLRNLILCKRNKKIKKYILFLHLHSSPIANVPPVRYINVYYLWFSCNLLAQFARAWKIVQEVQWSSLKCYRIFQTWELWFSKVQI